MESKKTRYYSDEEEEAFEPIQISTPQQERVKKMIMARNHLLQCFEEDDAHYGDILKQVYKYIEEKCVHEFVLDYVDVDCDRGGKYITYCEVCGFTPPLSARK